MFSDRVMAVPATVVYFTSYEQFKSFLGYSEAGPRSENWFKPVLAGSGARGKSNMQSLLYIRIYVYFVIPRQSRRDIVLAASVLLSVHTFCLSGTIS